MDEKTLTRLLRAEGTEAEPPGRSCPDEALLSAWVEHQIPEDKRAKVEAHLADCEACLGQVAFLARQPAEPPTSVPPGAVARARDLVALPSSSWRPLVLRWGTALAGAACVVLVVVAVLRQGPAMQAPATTPVPDAAAGAPSPSAPDQPAAPQAAGRQPSVDLARGDPERAPRPRSGRVEGPPAGVTVPPAAGRQPPAGVTVPPAAGRQPPAVRTSSPALRSLAVVSPVEAATLARKDFEFRWQAVPGTLYYEIDLVTEDGTSVWHSRVEDTSARPPDGTRLDAGAKYFVWVKAFLSGGETVKSAAVSFHIAGR
jgi:hypothetical protein